MRPARVKDPPDPIGITALSFQSPYYGFHPEIPIPVTTTPVMVYVLAMPILKNLGIWHSR